MTVGMILWRVYYMGAERFAAQYTKSDMKEIYMTVYSHKPLSSYGTTDMAKALYNHAHTLKRTDSFDSVHYKKQTLALAEEAVGYIMSNTDEVISKDLNKVRDLYYSLYGFSATKDINSYAVTKEMRHDMSYILNHMEDTL